MKQEVAQMLVSLDKFNTAENYTIFVPSVNKPVQFSYLTVKQQKDMLKSAFDTKTSVFLFIETFNRIIADACKEPIAFNIIDKAIIALHFKEHFFKGKSYAKKKDDTLAEFDLSTHLNTIPAAGIPDDLVKKTIVSGPLTVECSVPTLAYETAISAESRGVINAIIQEKKEENLRDAVGEIYIFEILKFINTIKYTFNNEPVVIDMTIMPLKEKAVVFENLPSTVNNLIIDYIKSIRNFEKTYLSVGDLTISIDPTFFNKTD